MSKLMSTSSTPSSGHAIVYTSREAEGRNQSGGYSAALMFGTAFVVNLAVSIVAPLLPGHLSLRRLVPDGSHGAFIKGLLFATNPFTTLVVTPWSGFLKEKVGRTVLCLLGLLTFALGNILFGFAEVLAPRLAGVPFEEPSSCPQTELIILFICRMVSASGGALASLTSTAMALEANSESRGVIMGASETALGIGFSVGPSFGAAFAMAGGFQAPFAAVGAMSLGLLLLLAVKSRPIAVVAPLENDEEAAGPDERLSVRNSTSAVAVLCMSMASMFGFGFLDPTLAPFEKDTLGADTAGAGVLFSCTAFPYALLGTVVGAMVDDRPHLGAPMICIGCGVMGLLIAALPPLDSFTGLMATWPWQAGVLLAVGFATASGMVPTVPKMMEILEDEARTTGRTPPTEDDVLANTYQAWTLGEMLGPLVGSFLDGALGFPVAARSVGLGIAATSLCTASILSYNGRLCPQRAPVLLGAEPLLSRLPSARSSEFLGMDSSRAISLAREVGHPTRHQRSASTPVSV